MPRVSVVIPTYNRANLLLEAIDSVVRQSFQDFEVVVVDDGSTDDTADRLAGLDIPLQHVRLPHNERPGLLRNHGISAARGEFIAFLDDDDLWHPDKLAQLVALLDGDETLGFVYSDIYLLYPDRSTAGPMLSPQHKQAALLFDHLLENCFIFPSSLAVRRRLFDRLGRFDESLATGEDYDLWLRLAYHSKAGYLPMPLAYIRRHPVSQSNRHASSVYQNTILVLERTMHTLPLTLRQRLRARRTLSNLYIRTGLAALKAGDAAAARRCFVQSLRLNPLQRQIWTHLKQSYTSSDR